MKESGFTLFCAVLLLYYAGEPTEVGGRSMKWSRNVDMRTQSQDF